MQTDKPLVSFLVFAYKQEHFIQDAIRGAFTQTYEPLEIILSDDCSPDRTFDIIREQAESYKGPHKVIVNRNEKNLGLAGHINHVFSLARGKFFVMSAGDDISVPQRTELLVNRWQDKAAPVDLVCSYFEEIDASGKPTGFTKKEVVFTPDTAKPVRQWKCGATGACVGYDRKLYDKYGPIDPRILAEDWVFSFRAWLESGIALIEEPLVKHRTHGQNISELHKNIKQENDAEIRHRRRCANAANKLARVMDWHRSIKISEKEINNNIDSEFVKWIQLLKYEAEAFNASRLKSLKLAAMSLLNAKGTSSAIRIFVRNVLRYR